MSRTAAPVEEPETTSWHTVRDETDVLGVRVTVSAAWLETAARTRIRRLPRVPKHRANSFDRWRVCVGGRADDPAPGSDRRLPEASLSPDCGRGASMFRSNDILGRPTLVLNRSWQPIHVTTVVRALVMLWNESAKVVEPEEYRLYAWDEWMRLAPREGAAWIRTPRARLRIPEVIALRHYDRLPRAAVAFSRRNVAKRDHYTCQYCGAQPGAEDLTIDHVVPRSQGGQSSWTNCVAACVPCNARKADRTPEQAGMRLRKSPARPDWKPLYATAGPDQAPPVESWRKFLAVESARARA